MQKTILSIITNNKNTTLEIKASKPNLAMTSTKTQIFKFRFIVESL